MQKRRNGVFFAYIGVILLSFFIGDTCEVEAEEALCHEDADCIAKTYIVAQDGTGDFLTIQEAVDEAKTGDTVRILPGVYHESVKIYGKAIRLEGISKEHCMIQYSGEDYMNPPLDMSSGVVSNLTICAMVSDVEERVGSQAYAVHVDKDPCGDKKTLFQNCRILSETSACFGIGLWAEQSIYIEDCEIISCSYTPNIYLHDVEFAPYAGESRFVMTRCTLRRKNYGHVMLVQAFLPDNMVQITFHDVLDLYEVDLGNPKICAENKYEAEGTGWYGLHNMYLTEDSSGNTIEEMNYYMEKAFE